MERFYRPQFLFDVAMKRQTIKNVFILCVNTYKVVTQ